MHNRKSVTHTHEQKSQNQSRTYHIRPFYIVQAFNHSTQESSGDGKRRPHLLHISLGISLMLYSWSEEKNKRPTHATNFFSINKTVFTLSFLQSYTCRSRVYILVLNKATKRTPKHAFHVTTGDDSVMWWDGGVVHLCVRTASIGHR